MGKGIMDLDIFEGKEKLEVGKEPVSSKPEKKEVKTPEVKADEYVMVELDACWADEFNVCHAWAMTKEEYDEGVKSSKEYFEGKGYTEIYFGTNEAIDVRDFADYMRNLTVSSITKEDYEAFNRMFGGSFGMFDYYFPYGDY